MKKSKAIENMCSELGLETQPPCTEEVCAEFNELRSDMVLLYELKVSSFGYSYSRNKIYSNFGLNSGTVKTQTARTLKNLSLKPKKQTCQGITTLQKA